MVKTNVNDRDAIRRNISALSHLAQFCENALCRGSISGQSKNVSNGSQREVRVTVQPEQSLKLLSRLDVIGLPSVSAAQSIMRRAVAWIQLQGLLEHANRFAMSFH